MQEPVREPSRWYGVISLFPEMFQTFTQQGVIGRAVKKRIVTSRVF